MTENQLRQKVVKIAVSYLGCKEADGSHRKIIDLYNSHKPLARGYAVKYTDAWCSTFASAVAIAAGLTDIIPTECGCEKHIALFKKLGAWVENDAYVPKPGDYIFYDWQDGTNYATTDNTGAADHVGIVTEVNGSTITVIEGNMSDAVGYRHIAVNGRYIRGYGVPKYASKATGTDVGTTGGGTGGTGARRGAGESKLEVDRRHIRRRIDALKTELAALARRREQRRTRRKKDGVTTVAIVGYTNVGKSTLLNTLTQAGVLAEDKLFATLDPTARALALPDGRKVMLIDTVGLVRRLPHQLVEAFHSTLEEAASADLILSVCDITSPELLEQRAVTERLLEELGVEGTPVITVLNKCDAAPDAQNEPYKGCVRISAKTGYGLPRLLQTIAETLPPQRIRCRLCLPYAEGALLHRLEEQGQIFSREYTAEGTLLDAEVEQRDWRLYETYLKTED